MSIRTTAHVSRFMLTVVLALTLLALSLGVIAHRSSATDAAGGKYWMAGGAVQRCCLMAQATPQSAALMAAAQPAYLNLMASVTTPRIALMA